MQRPYPLKFQPRFTEKIWGGRKLESALGKSLAPGKLIGESWELYDFPPGVIDGSREWVSSRIINGPLAGQSLHNALRLFGADLYGNAALAGQGGQGQFPVLIKFLDAREDLSVQVHPDQAYASTHPAAHLKSEAWYVLQSDPGARLLAGLKPGTTRKQFEAAVRRGEVDRIIGSVDARAGQCFYLPGGAVHALGAGILAAEIQMPSDTTFRVFDFNRVDPATGRLRELHVEQALDCIDFAAPPVRPIIAAGPRLVDSPWFGLSRVQLAAGGGQALEAAKPHVLIAIEGAARVLADEQSEPVSFHCGEVILIPAATKNARIRSDSGCAWLAVELPE